MIRDLYLRLAHRDMILGMPWATQCKVSLRPQQGATEVCSPGADDRLHLSVLPTAPTSSKVRGVESASQDKGRM